MLVPTGELEQACGDWAHILREIADHPQEFHPQPLNIELINPEETNRLIDEPRYSVRVRDKHCGESALGGVLYVDADSAEVIECFKCECGIIQKTKFPAKFGGCNECWEKEEKNYQDTKDQAYREAQGR